MQKFGVKPDVVTTLVVLSACSHAGLIDEGFKFFSQMRSTYGIKPCIEHYSCFIDLFGRAGRLLEVLSSLRVTCTRIIHWDIDSQDCLWRNIQMMHQPTLFCSFCVLLVSHGPQQGESDWKWKQWDWERNRAAVGLRWIKKFAISLLRTALIQKLRTFMNVTLALLNCHMEAGQWFLCCCICPK